ncbi:Anthocyanidin 3-O-glucosyltransferase 7-like protein [Drosera capensis]
MLVRSPSYSHLKEPKPMTMAASRSWKGVIMPQSPIEALEASGITFLWSLNDKAAEHLPKGFKERIGSRGKVVTHGGWNSIIENIIAGVPMICRPFLGDQMLNTRLIETVWKIGTRLEGDVFMKTGTLAALEKVIQTQEGKQMRANVAELKSLAEAAVQPNGSSNKNMQSLIKPLLPHHTPHSTTITVTVTVTVTVSSC